jgi:hypothetical protein
VTTLGAPSVDRATISTPVEAGYCQGRNTLGKAIRIRADLRPKGVAPPAVGETWTITRDGPAWMLDRLIGHPDPSEVTGQVAAGSALAGLISALAEGGTIVDATVPPPAPTWVPLTLSAGWAAYTTPVSGTAPPVPAYLIGTDQVFLRGMATNAADVAAGLPLAVLPVAARPATIKVGLMVPEVSTSTTAQVRLDYLPNGELRVVFAQTADKLLALDSLRWPRW